jgi:tetratricopeptide (TPR) repeat protein
MDHNLKGLRKKLIKGKVEEAIFDLSLIARDELKDKNILKELSVIQFRWEGVKTEERQSIISHEKASITKNQITSSLLTLLDKVEHILEHGYPPEGSKSGSRIWMILLISIVIIGAIGTFAYFKYFADNNSLLDSAEFIDCPFEDTITYNILIHQFRNSGMQDQITEVERSIRDGLIQKASANDLNSTIRIHKEELSFDEKTAKEQLKNCQANLLIWGSYERVDSISINMKYVTDNLAEKYMDNDGIMTANGSVRSLLSLENGELISKLDDVFNTMASFITSINLISEGKADMALSELDKIDVKNEKMKNVVAATKGDIHLMKGNYDEAIKNYSKSSNYGSQQEKAKAFNNIAFAKFAKGDSIGAIENFEKALELDAQNKDINENYQIVKLEFESSTQTTETTLTHIPTAAPIKPKKKKGKKMPEFCDNVADCINTGNRFREKKEFDEALKYFNAAIEYNAGIQDPYIGIGNVFFDQQRCKEALKYYNKAIKVEPDFPNAYYFVHLIYDKCEKDQDKANKYYKEWMKLTNGKGKIIQRTFDEN